jgi:hypothetical protein
MKTFIIILLLAYASNTYGYVIQNNELELRIKEQLSELGSSLANVLTTIVGQLFNHLNGQFGNKTNLVNLIGVCI